MYPFKIGVLVDSFRLPAADALKKAAELGAKGIQVYSTYNCPMFPDNLSQIQRKEYLDMVKSNGLVISALCGDLGSGFDKKEKNPKLIEDSKKILDLAKELETNIVTTHIGVVPEDTGCDKYKVMQEACFELSRYADSLDAHFAIETGPEKANTLRAFLDTLNSTGVAVNLDPANLVMCVNDDPVEAVYELQKYIVHTHAKDGISLPNKSEEDLRRYGVTKDDIQEGVPFVELPLGRGGVPFPQYLKALNDINYKGFLTIEREVGDNPEADIRMAVDYLQQLCK